MLKLIEKEKRLLGVAKTVQMIASQKEETKGSKEGEE